MSLGEAVYTAEVDRAVVESWFADVGGLTEVLEVRVRRRGERSAAREAVSLAEARVGWNEGSVTGVQVRYRWEGREWTDTLLPRSTGGNLVRMQIPGP